MTQSNTPLLIYPDPHRVNVDLHCHSSESDGVLAPDELAYRAKAHGVEIWALTDHDEVSGQQEAKRAAESIGLRYVSGVEISVTWANETIHVVGLQIDPDNQALKDGLRHTRSGRSQRAHEMAAQLAAVGIADAFEGALTYVGNPELISRTHFARYLVEAGVCSDTREVFARYLIEGKPGFVPHRWSTLTQAVTWIREAGGVAVLAHPARYRKLSDLETYALYSTFKELGGVGLEVVTGSHTKEEYVRYAKVANEFGFLASRGSDFHAPGESHVELGTLPPLPDSVVPIWHNW